MESLLYSKPYDSEVAKYSVMIKEKGVEQFLQEVNRIVLCADKYDDKTKHTKVSDSMIINYAVRNNKGKQFIDSLNLKLFLNEVLKKNSIIRDGVVVFILGELVYW